MATDLRRTLRAAGFALATVVGVVTSAHADEPAPPMAGDAVVALVGGEALVPGVDMILESDVRFRARLHLARAESRSVTISVELYRSTLDELIAEHLLAREAVRVDVRLPNAADELAVRRNLEAEAGGAEAFESLCEALGVDADELASIVRRRALADSFLRSNLAGTTTVSPGEITALIDSREHPFVDLPLEEQRVALRTWLSQRNVERAVARWVTVLRARNSVRLVRAPESS